MRKIRSIFLLLNTTLHCDWGTSLLHPYFKANRSQAGGICRKHISDESLLYKADKGLYWHYKKYTVDSNENDHVFSIENTSWFGQIILGRRSHHLVCRIGAPQ